MDTSASLALLWLTILLVPPGKVYGVDFLVRGKVMVIRDARIAGDGHVTGDGHGAGDGRPEDVAHVAAGGDEQDSSAHPDPEHSCHHVRLGLVRTT